MTDGAAEPNRESCVSGNERAQAVDRLCDANSRTSRALGRCLPIRRQRVISLWGDV